MMKNKFNYYNAIKFLSKYIMKYKKNFIMFYLGWLFDSALSFSMPIILGIMIDEVVYYQNIKTFVIISILYTVMCICSCVIYFIIYAQHHYLTNMYAYDIKMDVFDHYQNNCASYLTNTTSGDLVSVIQTYPPHCMHFVVRNIIHNINNILVIIASSLYLFNIHWQIGVLTLLAAPFSVFINIKNGDKTKKLSLNSTRHYRDYVGWLFDMIRGISDIRLLNAQNKTCEELDNKLDHVFKYDNEAGIVALRANNRMKLTSFCIKLLIFVVAGYLAKSGKITLGILTIIITFYGIISNKLEAISRAYIDGQSRLSYIQHIHNYLNTPTEEWRGKEELSTTSGKIEFKEVSFSYNEHQNVLNNFSLTINPGEKVALVGKSGCGKTTLVDLLMGFYPIEHGAIYIDNQDLNSLTLESIRKNIGVVSQEVLVFDGTIRYNLLLGKQNATNEEIEYACKQAGILDYINSLPEGFDTIIGSSGIDLSLGQKQRITIARIYLKNPSIIIFDEATSALDYNTELEIHKSWENVLLGKTAIIISHRPSAIMMADKAIIMENGRVVNSGSPTDVLARSGYFDCTGG